ncbi:hypothetical protein amb2724 [Paramagnetospirillum magneticum AMB-1]|uniref:B30.2/SPRY domain-containing protein n=2 Tax=Paramagnetospirillum magneticum TaxID=84159 RepID=Q2W3P7_PARM1|nr:hypothetical protein amb2724 [Paramagnetospirillum magneticum AMB-1]
MPSFEASFRNLYLNQRVDSQSPLIARSEWMACMSQDTIADGEAIYLALDLSSTTDLTALVAVSAEPTADRALAWFWKPGDLLDDHETRDRAPYRRWAAEGHLEAPPGRAVDYGFVAQHKRSKLGATSPIFDNKVYFTSGDALYAFGLTSTALYRDPSAWYHIFWNGTGVYVNGTLVTGTGTYTAASVTNPRLGFDGTNYFSGYMSDFAFWNGSSASLQGGISDANGVWAARKAAAGYSFLGFGSSGALGTDTSGNGNTWTVNGSPVQTTDTPTNNYATWNPLKWLSSSGFSNGNLTFNGSSSWSDTTATIAPRSGKWYAEVTITSSTGANSLFLGVMAVSLCPFNSAPWQNQATTYAVWYQDGGKIWNNTGPGYSAGGYVQSGLATLTAGKVLGIALDLDGGTVQFYVNNVAQGTAVALPYSSTEWTFWTEQYTGYYGTANFGATAFAYTPPTGFKALCTANLPAVSIKKPSDHFNTVLAAGASIKSSSEALYTYFLEWIKDRANSQNHQLIDTVRGTSAVLQSNTTAAETTYSAPSGTSVGWVWNSGAAAVTNNAGSVTSQVSANPTSGFSIVTWTHTTSGNYTVGHGLGATPKLIVQKSRSTALNWDVYHPSLAAGNRLILNSPAAQGTGYWTGPPSSTTIPHLTTSANNNDLMVAYCFAEIPGYSKFGSYTGNASNDGPFVYCGFRPRFILVKDASVGNYWNIYDTARSVSNPASEHLFPNLSNSELTNNSFDILSNGFKARTTGGDINAADTYIFAAFAEHPFGGSNVAPCPAR